MSQSFWAAFPTIQKQLNSLQPYLLQQADIKQTSVHQRVQQLITHGGKYVRAGLFYLFSQFGSAQDPQRLQAGAASIEFLHLATLIHDDVIDDAPVRRNTATVQTAVGNRGAIYAGDLLFTLYFDEVLKAAESFDDIATNTKAMRAILEGELAQYDLNFNTNEQVDEYLREIEGKTARLFALACSEGAKLAHAPEIIVETAEQIGRSLGLAYQIQDDVLDYVGDMSQIRKPVMEDIRTGVYALPLIFALETDQGELVQLLEKRLDLTDADQQRIHDLVLANDGVTRAQTMAHELTQQALLDIDLLPDQPAKKLIQHLTKKLLKRFS
ncbi:polyprenyl synthetase family protein [Loigolactobacillus bifermentans]|uniref:Trans-hexaprenyltranstransferase, component II n=1 Tax=Loigolactobacillus bifermentans DSM 20003 TaxID=1423726 RepID=A0A0R1H1H7_9LACO|nr:polyprenyl synthetase family protein [Loigolactobacillus bifermentans]KRK40309.1 trans-hexaprenyltranstransferase, component II [Loigolactobacillus bifermentans DSM 20003]QGG59983.1 polyprenyl synthetase family protein [Loigolactobacillus bifermentans]